MNKWKCRRCNFVLIANEPSETCPKCRRKGKFELMGDTDFEELYDE